MNNILRIILLSITIVFWSGCSDVLDVQNLGAFDPNATWNDPQLANAYLTNLYNDVMPAAWPVGSSAIESGHPADETVGVFGPNAITEIGHAWSGAFDNQYQDIRSINILLNEIDGGSLESDTRNTIVGQALFLRAWSYFNLVRVYGGVPLLLEYQGLDDDLLVPRAATLEVFNAILSDLDEAIILLDGQKFAENDKGRIGLASALAFKGRVALYMASPLFNPVAPFSNQYWAAALTATETARTQLESMGFSLNNTYADIWSVGNEGNTEAVLTVKFTDPDRSNGRREDLVRPLSQSRNATGGDQPVWKHVEAYPMADGYAPGSSPTYPYDLQTYWQNRDPRFYTNVVYNGAIFELSGINGRRQYTDAVLADPFDGFDESFEFARTGFYTRKGLQEELIVEQVALNDVDWVEIRYAEVLLNFAEAANEMGRGSDALDVLKQIRERAGIEPGAGNDYGFAGITSQEAIREAIYNERYIEFAYEGKRFWDLKRWRRLTDLNGETETGLRSTLKSGIDPATDPRGPFDYPPTDFDYEVVPILNAAFVRHEIPESYYFAPIPLNQLQRNGNLEQNVDWGGTFDPTF